MGYAKIPAFRTAWHRALRGSWGLAGGREKKKEGNTKGIVAVVLMSLVLVFSGGAMAEIMPGPLPWMEGGNYTLELATAFSNDGFESPFIGLRMDEPINIWGEDLFLGAGMSLTDDWAGVECTAKIDDIFFGLELVPFQDAKIVPILGYEYKHILLKWHLSGNRWKVGFSVPLDL